MIEFYSPQIGQYDEQVAATDQELAKLGPPVALRASVRAHRRLLSTLKALASVRRLALPAVQINLAQRQQIAQLNGGGST